jgi:GNAT superfamily N-acetyltransferase
MNEFNIYIRSINKLALTDVTAIYSRLGWEDGNIRKELRTRYIEPVVGPHSEMFLALVWYNGTLVSWVGTRQYPEKFKGVLAPRQTIECFTDPALRGRGFAQVGLSALIAAGLINRREVVAVYSREAIKLAERCGCRIVVFCDAEPPEHLEIAP